MRAKLFAIVAIVLMLVTAKVARADTIYTYISSSLNPIYVDQGQSIPPGFPLTTPDFITISFESPFTLAPSSTYDISVQPGATEIPFWIATDTRFGIALVGVNAPISLVPAPGSINGGQFNACGVTCFGGTVQTDQSGQIVQWNLLAAGAAGSPYLIFATYNNGSIGSGDLLGSAQDGSALVFDNQVNGPVGTWVVNSLNSAPLPAALPLFATGLGAMGLFGWRRKRKSTTAAAAT